MGNGGRTGEEDICHPRNEHIVWMESPCPEVVLPDIRYQISQLDWDYSFFETLSQHPAQFEILSQTKTSGKPTWILVAGGKKSEGRLLFLCSAFVTSWQRLVGHDNVMQNARLDGLFLIQSGRPFLCSQIYYLQNVCSASEGRDLPV